MKPTSILLGLSLITNINQSVLNNQKLTPDLSIKNVELVEQSSFDTLTTINFNELSGYENKWLIPNSEKPITVPNAEVCQQIFASASAACTYVFWNPPAYVVCMAAASAAYATCLAAS